MARPARLTREVRTAGLEAVAIVTSVVWLPHMTFWSGWLAFSALREDRSELALAA